MLSCSIENNFCGNVADGLPVCPSSFDAASAQCIGDGKSTLNWKHFAIYAVSLVSSCERAANNALFAA
jgi:hypothetical protein